MSFIAITSSLQLLYKRRFYYKMSRTSFYRSKVTNVRRDRVSTIQYLETIGKIEGMSVKR